ncbi:DUF4388 domain-containing protein [Ktedonosporobacter rubrisoli]|uniref:DUF4388 domain-containing protein n=1 Tax=Ktedonosporobacter rubrisoli TaxID=2509675 RepID=A0A4P6JZM4_KTERU|nr:DUF4388 domain-containing protein [Ktedonosporobacter rubrisoli]QBD80942.1 DUF4388 domain-containing protein [Ktedonosporobacter rubrisoli]
MSPRGIATDKLADVIQVLQTARKTGLLTVRRDGATSSVEQGSIILQSGQVFDASVGQLRGREAFDYLVLWGACFFAFQPLSSVSSDLLPAAGPMQTGPLNESLQTGPITEPIQTRTGQTGPIPRVSSVRQGSGELPSVAMDAPQRLHQPNEVLPYFNNFGLSRTHRQLFLLIDGKRSAHDLMRLMGYPPDVIHAMLAELERVGLIRQ